MRFSLASGEPLCCVGVPTCQRIVIILTNFILINIIQSLRRRYIRIESLCERLSVTCFGEEFTNLFICLSQRVKRPQEMNFQCYTTNRQLKRNLARLKVIMRSQGHVDDFESEFFYRKAELVGKYGVAFYETEVPVTRRLRHSIITYKPHIDETSRGTTRKLFEPCTCLIRLHIKPQPDVRSLHRQYN